MSTITANNVTRVDGGVVLGWTLLSTVVASDDATIDITGLTSEYSMYKFIWYAMVPASDGADLWIRTSTNGGSSYDAGTFNYTSAFHRVTMATSPLHTLGWVSNTHLLINDGNGSAANETSDYEITCFNPSGTEYTKFQWSSVIHDATNWRYQMGGGARESAANVDAVRFMYGVGNIESGTLKVYGVRA